MQQQQQQHKQNRLVDQLTTPLAYTLELDDDYILLGGGEPCDHQLQLHTQLLACITLSCVGACHRL